MKTKQNKKIYLLAPLYTLTYLSLVIFTEMRKSKVNTHARRIRVIQLSWGKGEILITVEWKSNNKNPTNRKKKILYTVFEKCYKKIAIDSFFSNTMAPTLTDLHYSLRQYNFVAPKLWNKLLVVSWGNVTIQFLWSNVFPEKWFLAPGLNGPLMWFSRGLLKLLYSLALWVTNEEK